MASTTAARQSGFSLTENGWRALLLITSVIILVFTVYCLSQGITIIFMHLYYFPIILLAYHYHKKGVILSAVLGILYVALVIFFTYPVMADIYGAGARFVVFVGIAAVVAYLSETLEKRERECSTIIANSEDGIFIVDLSRQVITEVNRRGLDMLGFTPGDLVNATLATIWQDTEERVRFSDLIKTESIARNIEAHLTHKTGGTRTVLLSAGLLPENRVVLTVTDITDRERLLSEMRRLSDVRESIIDNANVWLMVLDSYGRILEWNRAAEQISGYPAAEVIGGNEVWKRLYPEKDYRKEITGKITEIIQKNNYLENLQSTIVSKNGTKKTILWNTRGLPDKKGGIGSYIAIGVDITEQKHAELEISESEEKFHTMADFTADWEYWQGQDKQIIYMSPSCHNITGYTQQVFLADPNLLETIVHSDDLTSVREHNNVAWETRLALSTDFRIIHRDGTIRWISHACRQVYDDEGKALGRRVSNRDITDQKIASQALRESEAKFRAFFTTSQDCVFITSVDGRWIDFNNSAVELFGYHSREELMEVKIADLYAHPDERNAHLKTISEQGFIKEYPIDLKKKDGTIINTLITSVARRDQKGTIIGFQGTIRDITELKRAEMIIRESEQKFHAIFDATGDGMLLTDIETRRFVMANAAIQKLMGYTEAELFNLTISDIHPEADLPFVIGQFEKMVRGKSDSIPEVPVLRKDGTIFYCDISSSVLVTIQDRHYMLGIFHDITERKRMEDALRQVNKQLNLLSSITRHDILNQLMALKGYLYLSKEMIDDPTILAGYIQKEEQAANAIENQITFTRDYQELGVAAPEWQNVNASIEKAVAGLPMRAVRVEVDPNNPEVFADRLFEKVFYNLIDNALRYGGPDMKSIRVSSQKHNTGLQIVCEDDGVGITAEDKKKLFTRGFGKNTGLGLFLSREILAITGITITENGVPGKGARFEITVPKGMWRMKGANE